MQRKLEGLLLRFSPLHLISCSPAHLLYSSGQRPLESERAGFEPAVPEGTPVFETGPISRSGTSPTELGFYAPFAP